MATWYQTNARGAGPGGADVGSSRREEIRAGAAVLTLTDLARREHPESDMSPQTLPPGR